MRGLREGTEGREGRSGGERRGEEREKGRFQTQFPALSLEADTALLPELGPFFLSPLVPPGSVFLPNRSQSLRACFLLPKTIYVSLDLLSGHLTR